MRNDAILIQTCFSANPNAEYAAWTGIFYDMLRLCYPRHSAYARAHKMDYWCIMADVHPEMQRGAWPKIWLIRDALQAGYEHIAYLDTDAVIANMDCDLREALPEGKYIGAALHDPAHSEQLRRYQVPAHYNVGALYVKSGPGVMKFFDAWLASYPGHPRWQEQGAFNDLIQDNPLFGRVDDTWNATIAVNEVPAPNVMGYHGIMPPERRLGVMKSALREDHLRYRV